MTATRAARDIRIASAFAIALFVLPAALPAQQARLARTGAAPPSSAAPPARLAIAAPDTSATMVDRPRQVMIGILAGGVAGGLIGFAWPLGPNTTSREGAFAGMERPIHGIEGAVIGAVLGGLLGLIW
jgi:hypothetical protein